MRAPVKCCCIRIRFSLGIRRQRLIGCGRHWRKASKNYRKFRPNRLGPLIFPQSQQHTKAVTLGVTRHNINCTVAVEVSGGYSPCAWSNWYRCSRLKRTASIAQEHAYAVATSRNDIRAAIAIHVGDDYLENRTSNLEWRSIRFGKPATAIANHHGHCTLFVMGCDDVWSTITVQIRNRGKPWFGSTERELMWCEATLSVR